MKKTLLVIGLFGLLTVPTTFAEEVETVEPTVNSADALYGDNGRYSSVRTFHFNRGMNGEGYTRYAGRRFSDGSGYASAYSKSAQRAAIRKAYNAYMNQGSTMKTESVQRPVSNDYLNAAGYSPVYTYHRNQFTPGYTRYEVRRATTGDVDRRGGRLYGNYKGRPALDTLDYWRNTGRTINMQDME